MNTRLAMPFLLPSVRQQIRRVGPLGAIILLHIGFFYALQSGLLRQAAAVLPKEIVATLITLEAVREQPKPPPPAPKTVPVVKKAVARPAPAVPVINNTPSPQAITVPPPEATPVDEPKALPVAPVPPAPAQPKTMTSGIEYLQPPQPEYPSISKRMGEEGKTVLRVLVNDKGRPERVEVQKTSGVARLDEAARHAVLRALFKPFMEDGKAVAAYAIVPISFNLDN